MAHYANVYELDRSYGGPEEGGWWVTTKTPMASYKFLFKVRARNKLANLKIEFESCPRFPLHSVNYEGGHYSFAIEDSEAEFSPKGPIHYE